MADDRLTFSPTVEALFLKGMGSQLTPALRERLAAAGLDLSRPLLPAYPAGRVAEWIELVLPEVYPGEPRPEALRRLGRRSVDAYTETAVGRALLSMLRLVGLRRVLQRMTSAMRTGGNYLETHCTVHGPADVELWINDVNGMPEYFEGMLVATAAMCRVEAEVSLVAVSPPACTLRVRWAE